jgi:hypothetical protein
VVALIDSSGYLEVPMLLGNAARLLDTDLETPVTVSPVVVRLKKDIAVAAPRASV